MIHPTMFLAIFGESYIGYPFILTIIAAANAVNDLTGSNGTLLAMTGKEKWELFNGLLYFAVYFISIFVFSFDTIYGLSYALLVSQIFVNIAKYVEVWVLYKIPPLKWKSIFTIIITLIFNFAVIFVLKYLNINMWLWLSLGIVVGIALVALNFFVLSLYKKTDIKKMISLKL